MDFSARSCVVTRPLNFVRLHGLPPLTHMVSPARHGGPLLADEPAKGSSYLRQAQLVRGGDQVLKGAASNPVQIAERLVDSRMIRGDLAPP